MTTNASSPLGDDTVTAERRRLADPAYRAERQRRAPYEQIARLVITHRMRTGLTQKDLANQAGTSEAAICRLERGDHAPSVKTLDRLAAVFGKELVVDFVPAASDAAGSSTRIVRRLSATEHVVSIKRDPEGELRQRGTMVFANSRSAQTSIQRRSHHS